MKKLLLTLMLLITGTAAAGQMEFLSFQYNPNDKICFLNADANATHGRIFQGEITEDFIGVSCDVRIPTAEFDARWQFCALADIGETPISGGGCSFNDSASGKYYRFSNLIRQKNAMNTTTCRYVCLKR